MDIPFQSVVCPVDTSETGNCAIPVAYRLAGNGGTVHLLHVCEPPYLGNPLYRDFVQGVVPTPEEVEHGREKLKKRLHNLIRVGALEEGIRTRVHLVEGVNVANLIEEEAQRLGAEAVVMGTHGRTGIGRVLMGSVAMAVVKRLALPVILVHADVADRR